MKKIKLFTFTIVIFCAMMICNSLYAQVTQTLIDYGAPKLVNFNERAQYDVKHPQKLKRRFVEQGEDRDNFVFKPQPVDANAINNKVTLNNPNTPLSNSPVASVNINGVMDNGTLIPPDINGAVGITYVMETTNQEFKIYTKSGSLTSTVSITTFFSATGGSGYYDPHICYDPNNDRFIICIDGNVSNGHGGLFIAVSQTGNPTGNWYTYSIDATGNTSDFLDYPQMGFNTNWIVLTGNDFLGTGGNAGKIYVFNRAGLYSGTQGSVNTFTDNTVSLISPATTYDNSQTTEYMVADWNGNSGGNGYVKIFTITGSATAPVYSAGNTIGVNQPWSESTVGAKQLGSSNTIEDGDTRIHSCIYRSGSLWFCHSVFLPASSPTHTANDWWQVNPSNSTVTQFGRIEDTNGSTFYYYPSLDVNANGDMMIGYSMSGTSNYASAVYAYRASTDALNTLQSPVIYKAGVASYYKTFGSGRNRFGDYSGTAFDPSNNSFWTFQEWANTSNNWATQIANVPATGGVTCNAPTGMSTSGITNTSATFSWTAVSGASSYNVQYRKVGTSTWTTASSLSTSYSASGLTAGTNYEWQVQTVCSGGGTSVFTASTTFTTTGTAPCNAPTGLTTSSITSTSATFSWGAVSGAPSYNVQYRKTGTTTWSTASTSSASYNATGLTTGTTYEWQVQTVCSGGGTSSFTASTTFTTTGITYCSSVGKTLDGITNVTFNTINNTTSGTTSGYTDYTGTQSTTVSQNSTYTLSVKINTGGNYTNYTKAWIDWNHDGTFSTTTNEEYNLGTAVNVTSGTTSLSPVSVLVPSTAVVGTTRMRVSTQYNANPTPCSASFDGEVEDYSVVVSSGGTSCGIPSGLSSSSITSSGATVSWGAVSGATSYNLQYKVSTTSTWTTVSTSSTSYNLTGLTAGTTYNYQVQAVCSGGSSSYSSQSSFTTLSGTVTYCASKGSSTAYEYISKILLGSINNTSGNNNGYGNYTNLSTSLAAGVSNTITMTPGFASSSYTEYWTLYIDYNHNGILNDAGETVATGSGTAAVSKSFTVPSTALNGATRMRIQMHYNSSSTNPCATLDYGEVEDYTVSITGGQRLENTDLIAKTISISVSPNPVSAAISVAEFQLITEGNVRLEIFDLYGKQVQAINTGNQSEGKRQYEIAHLDELAAGNYVILLFENNQLIARNKFVIAE
ncbi:MAG: fibronectin type III domain-containing protein [Chitinophagales bacterium]|nr:fibronectin type III domain-containing protein [Chitinophagales bacterium]